MHRCSFKMYMPWQLRRKEQPLKAEANTRAPLWEVGVRWHRAVLQLWAPFTRPTPWDTVPLSYSHRVLQGVLDFSLSQEHIPPAHPPKHALKSRDALPVNHTSHEAVGRRARLGNLFRAMGWKALWQRRKTRRGTKTQTMHCYVKRTGEVLSLGLEESCLNTTQGLNPDRLRNTSQQAQRGVHLEASEGQPLALLNSENEQGPTEYGGLKWYLPKPQRRASSQLTWLQEGWGLFQQVWIRHLLMMQFSLNSQIN